MTFLRSTPMIFCAASSVWKKCQNRNLCLLLAKFDPLWSQSQLELSRLQDQNTKLSSPRKRLTTMLFSRYMYTFPELGLHCAFSSLSRTLKLILLSNSSWLIKRQVKSCSVMEIKLNMVSLCNGMFRLFQTSLLSNNVFLRKHLSLYYQFLVFFRVSGNYAQSVKYLQ